MSIQNVDKLRKLREEKGLSQNRLAKIIGISGTRYQNYEKGIRKLPVEIAKVISKTLEINWWEIYEEWKEDGMANINLGNANFKMYVSGVDETLDKLNSLEEKLKEVKSLIHEITSLEVKINFVNSEKQEDETSYIQRWFSLWKFLNTLLICSGQIQHIFVRSA